MMTHQARRRFGQNFLHDPHIIHQIVHAIRPATRTHLVEIGPGQGALTFPLLKEAKAFSAIEIDRDLIAFLKSHAPKDFQLIEGDVLKFDFGQFKGPITVVGNLPYNISTPLLFHLLQFKDRIDEMFFMLQKEVVIRMAAPPGSKDYGRLSVMVQYFCEVSPLFLVPPHAFTPAPQVDSMIIRLKPHSVSPYGTIKDFSRFEKLVLLAFNQRRKTLKNALKVLDLKLPEALASKRAEALCPADFVALSNL